jgi:hypothetical protein
MSERESIVKCVADAMDCVETLLTENIDVAMDRFN